MNSVNDHYIRSLLQRYESDCLHAANRITHLKTIPEIVRAAQVSANAIVRPLTRSSAGQRRLQQQAEQSLEKLVDAQLAQAEAVIDPADRRSLIGKFRHQEWDHLRGHFPNIWRRADRSAQELRNW